MPQQQRARGGEAARNGPLMVQPHPHQLRPRREGVDGPQPGELVGRREGHPRKRQFGTFRDPARRAVEGEHGDVEPGAGEGFEGGCG